MVDICLKVIERKLLRAVHSVAVGVGLAVALLRKLRLLMVHKGWLQVIVQHQEVILRFLNFERPTAKREFNLNDLLHFGMRVDFEF